MLDTFQTGLVLTLSYGSYIIEINTCELLSTEENPVGYRKTISQNSFFSTATDNLFIGTLDLNGQKNIDLEIDLIVSSTKFKDIHLMHNSLLEDKTNLLKDAYININNIPLQGNIPSNPPAPDQFIQLSDQRIEDPFEGGFKVYSIFFTSLTPIEEILYNHYSDDLYRMTITARTI